MASSTVPCPVCTHASTRSASLKLASIASIVTP